MFYEFNPATMAVESTNAWLMDFRDVPQLPLLFKRFYPERIEQERLMVRAGDYLVRYAAWESVRLGRASLIVGNPYDRRDPEVQLPFTGFEAHLAGSNAPMAERVRLIAQMGAHFERIGHIVFGNAKFADVLEFLNGNMETISRLPDNSLRSMAIIADTLFTWVRHQFKYHTNRNEPAVEDFKQSTYGPLRMMPASYYMIDPINYRVRISVPIPREALARHGEPYGVDLTHEERAGYSFMLTLSQAALPPLAAIAQDMLDPLEHQIEIYY